METLTITINGKKFPMKPIDLGLWLETAKIYDEIQKLEYLDAENINLRKEIFKIVFGLTEEEALKMPIEDVIPTYGNVVKILQDMLISKVNKKNAVATDEV